MNKALLFVSFLLTLVACKDETEEESKEPMCSEISEEVKQLMFREGSFWVYEDSISSVNDTVEVLKIDYWLYDNRKGGICEHEYKIELKSSERGGVEEYAFSGVIALDPVEKGPKGVLFTSYAALNATAEKIDSYSVGGVTYSGVYKVTSLPDEKLEKEQISYYKEGVGLLSKQVYDQGQMIENWILTESNVTPYW